VRYLYFPGCTARGSAVEYEISTKAIASKLGIELVEIDDWVCCGATMAHVTDKILSLTLPAKSLASARSMGGGDVVTSCAACFNRLKIANYEIGRDRDVRAKVAEALGQDYPGDVPVKHLLNVLMDDLGAELIRRNVERPLEGIRVACYYGCLLLRPPKIMQFDDPEDPSIMDRLVEVLGAEAVDWSHKTECCGASFTLSRTDIVLELSNAILSHAKEAGADCVVAACPLCQPNLDMRQEDIKKKYGIDYNLPILYFTQLVGLALGLGYKELGLDKIMVDCRPMLRSKGFEI